MPGSTSGWPDDLGEVMTLFPREPLWMPRGSVRALLALGLVASACAGFFIGYIEAKDFMQLATAAVAFYFAGRQNGGSHA